MKTVNIVIACVVGDVFTFDNTLLDRFQLISRVGAITNILIRQNEMHILENQRIAVRRTACNVALQAVSADHTLPPCGGFVLFRCGKLCVIIGIGHFVARFKKLGRFLFFALA